MLFRSAIVAGDKIIHKRGMSAKKINREFLRLRAEYPDGWAMWHSRYATHGVKNESNCHPYPVGDDGLTYLAHNGTLSQDIAKGDKRSDSRVFAEDTLTAMGGVVALNNPTVRDMIGKWASSSKLAILTIDPRADYTMYLINEKLGHWIDGVWYSNYGYKPEPTYPPTYWDKYPTDTKTTTYSSPLDETDIFLEYCYKCGNTVDIPYDSDEYNCPNCNSCFECYQVTGDCLCYQPALDKVSSQGWSYGW